MRVGVYMENETNKQQNIRPVHLEYDVFGYADASVLLAIGGTKVLCSISLQHTVPQFLRGKNTGWLTAEYAMLPCATTRRTTREATQRNRNSRSVEISRLIGRSLRSVVDVSFLPEKTIVVDCDVLQADGGTRVASITAASCTLQLAQQRWMKAGIISQPILQQPIAAISVGIRDGEAVLDLDQHNDMQAQADFNFVLTKSGDLIEVQGTAEKSPICWERFDQLRHVAIKGVQQLFYQCDQFSYDVDKKVITYSPSNTSEKQVKVRKERQDTFFSLKNRQLSTS